MANGPSDNERILSFVEDCRDAHVAPYPVGTRVIRAQHRSAAVPVRAVGDQLLSEGRLMKMPAYPDYGVVLP
jgi:hypothetical protein